MAVCCAREEDERGSPASRPCTMLARDVLFSGCVYREREPPCEYTYRPPHSINSQLHTEPVRCTPHPACHYPTSTRPTTAHPTSSPPATTPRLQPTATPTPTTPRHAPPRPASLRSLLFNKDPGRPAEYLATSNMLRQPSSRSRAEPAAPVAMGTARGAARGGQAAWPG